jgi:CubicO group peptidase (beta-lactamase class C family)
VGVLEQAGEWPAETVAVAVTTADEEIETFGAQDEVLPWASVTKLVSAYTALMVIDEGIAELDEPAGPDGATVRHLLAHASGLPMNGDEPIANPAERRIYSNAGFEVLARHVEARTRIPFPELVEENVLGPLGMRDSALDGSAAHAIHGPLRDLIAFARELLAPTLVSEGLFDRARTVEFEGLAGVLPGFGRQEPNEWGLGFEVRGEKDPHWTGSENSGDTFGHFGQSGSFLWVDPEHGVACASLADRDFGEWAQESWPRLSDDVLTELS